MLKSKRAIIGITAGALVVGLTLVSMAISTTSGAGTDTTPQPTKTATSVPAPTATPIVSAPAQSPVEPPSGGAAPINTGDQAGAGTLPSTGYGAGDGGTQGALYLLAMACLILTAGAALTLAGRMPGGRNK